MHDRIKFPALLCLLYSGRPALCLEFGHHQVEFIDDRRGGASGAECRHQRAVLWLNYTWSIADRREASPTITQCQRVCDMMTSAQRTFLLSQASNQAFRL